MASRSPVLKYFSGRRVLIPILIGLGIAGYFIWNDYDPDAIRQVDWRQGALWWVLASVGMMLLRDVGYIIRLRILSRSLLSWKQCFEIAFLWEFASAISPSAIGGTAVAVVIMAQENIRTGLTTAIVLITAFLDELFYIIMVPIMLLVIGKDALFPQDDGTVEYMFSVDNLSTFFWLGYAILFAWTLFLAFAILIKPNWTQTFIRALFRLPYLRRRQERGNKLAADLHLASLEFVKMKFPFWLKAFGATFLSWSARFLMLNCLLMAFSGFEEHFLSYGRQLVMWVIMLVAFTPGASGIAESIFPFFMKEFLPGRSIARIVAIVWRMISYYPYLIIGFVILPLWLKRTQGQEPTTELDSSSAGEQ